MRAAWYSWHTMNVLMMGIPFCASEEPVRLFRSRRGHRIRFLIAEGHGGPFPAGPKDFSFDPREDAVTVLERVSREWRVDALVCWCPELFPPPRAIETCPVLTAAIPSDWNVYYPTLEHNLARYDVVLTDRPGAELLKFPGAQPRFLFPIYSQRSPLHRKIDIEKDIDVLFVGNLNASIHMERGRCLERLATLSDECRAVVCSGFYDEEYTRLLNRTRIVFNHSVRGEMNLRCFETLACGALLFIEEGNLEAGDWLRDGEEAVFFKPENLVEKLRYCLQHPDEAARIAERGHARADALAGENRLDTLLDWLAKQPRGPRSFSTFDESTRAISDVLQYASSLVTPQRDLATAALAALRSRFPEQPEVLAASACAALDDLAALSGQERKQATRSALEWFGKAAELAPEAAVFRFNLASIARLASAVDVEVRFLERVIDVPSTAYGGLLLGTFGDRYYAIWRKDLALGRSRIETLWAAAANRLAEICLDQGRLDEAAEWARRSIGWLDGVGAPYRTLARAEASEGRFESAADLLTRSLSYTAFDAGHRLDLIVALEQSGRRKEARALAEESRRLFSCRWDCQETVSRFREHES